MRNALNVPICQAIATMCLVCAANAADPTKALQNVLNKSDYNLVNPAQDRIFAGGIVVSDKKHSSFYGVPPGVTPEGTTPVTAAWAKADLTSSFSLQALLSGIGSVVNAGLGFKRDKQLTLEQIDATGFQVDHPETVIANNTVKAQVTKWLQKYNVYIVHTALATSNISVTASSSFDVKAAFGTALPTCPAPANGAKPTTDSAGSGGAAGAGTTANTAGTRAVDGANAATAATAAAGSVSKAAPTASLDVCQASSSKLTLSVSKPLVFAVSLNPVTMDASGALQVEPVLKVAPGNGIRALQAPAVKWQAVSWPNMK
jgi:hypothetical protein